MRILKYSVLVCKKKSCWLLVSCQPCFVTLNVVKGLMINSMFASLRKTNRRLMVDMTLAACNNLAIQQFQQISLIVNQAHIRWSFKISDYFYSVHLFLKKYIFLFGLQRIATFSGTIKNGFSDMISR